MALSSFPGTVRFNFNWKQTERTGQEKKKCCLHPSFLQTRRNPELNRGESSTQKEEGVLIILCFQRGISLLQTDLLLPFTTCNQTNQNKKITSTTYVCSTFIKNISAFPLSRFNIRPTPVEIPTPNASPAPTASTRKSKLRI